METTFDFNITNNEYIYNVNSTINLHIKKINNSVAVLYFTDEMSNKINIPGGLAVYTYDYTTNKKIIQNAINQDYLLCWTDDYIIELNKIVLIDIRKQKKWNIMS